ncbi:MAG: glycogen synthase [Lactobacillales bacterium]|nr:glycogen synthase [Lactobacillales bacterium]
MTQNVLFVASEMMPFIRTGGLGEVVGSLPKSLVGKDVNIKAVIPMYVNTGLGIDYQKFGLKKVMDGNCVPMGDCHEFFAVHMSDYIPGVEVYFIEFNKYFDRRGVYQDRITRAEYVDNGFRYAFLCRAALQVAKDLNFKPDIIHAHDWQTALIPYYMKKTNDPFFAGTKTLLTIHNLMHQGHFMQDVIPYAKIDRSDFHQNAFEDYGRVNFLKAGIRYADKINTVSPQHAREILTPEFGGGLDFLLRERQNDLSGILNGIDTNFWNPRKDEIIPAQYSLANFEAGKQKNKLQLVETANLESVDKPIFSMAVRLSEQKGIRMLAESIEPVLNTMQAQFVIMGEGEPWAQEYFASLPKKYPGQIAVHIGFNNDFEHWMDAGSDFSLIPSLYEPCGLKQMLSQTYGALPIVRSTGGLVDTVSNYNEFYGVGTGFKFTEISPRALYNTIGWANATYYDRPEHISMMKKMAMKQNYSWDKSSGEYQNLYQTMLKG